MKSKICSYKDHYEDIRSVRDNVFIIEQNVSKEIEFDGLDDKAVHVVIFDGKIAIGTGRLLPDGHIGRVSVKKEYRKIGAGKLVVQSLIDEAKRRKINELWLSAQLHAKEFYESLGFIAIGEVYKEANIDHIKMVSTL